MNCINEENVRKVVQMVNKIYHHSSIKDFFSEQLNDLTKEIDDIVQNFISQYPENAIEKAGLNFGNGDVGVSPEKQDEVIELLNLNPRKRRRFCCQFLSWKQNRLELVNCLREIAGELQIADKNLNRMDTVASVSGFSAGLIHLAKMAKSDIMPGYVKNAAYALSATDGIIKCYTSVKREYNLERLRKTAEEIIEKDKRLFEEMMSWFDYNAKLMDSVKSAIGSELYKLIFVTIKTIYDEIRLTNPSKNEYYKILFNKIMEFLVKKGIENNLAASLSAASLKLFVQLSSALLTLDWPDAALHVSRIANYGKAAIYGGYVAIAVNNIFYPCTAFSNSIVSCIGIISGLSPAVFGFGATNEQVENILKIAETMQEEIDRIESVYTALNSK